MAFPDLERVASFPTAAEAEVVRGLLAASGIDARVAATNHLARGHIPTGGVAVLVPSAELARARDIVASARVPDEPAEAPATPAAPAPARAALGLGLALVGIGAVALLLAPGAREASGGVLLVGALLAAIGALARRAALRGRPRRRE